MSLMDFVVYNHYVCDRGFFCWTLTWEEKNATNMDWANEKWRDLMKWPFRKCHLG